MFRIKFSLIVASIVLLDICATRCIGQDDTPLPQEPVVVGASEEAQQAIEGYQYPEGLECKVFAAEPDVANIVAFHRDYQGRFFVCETFRQERGVEDNRRHAHWMNEELAAQTVQDRIDYVRKYIPDADKLYTNSDDRIRLVMDTDGDGKADKSTVFANRFNRLEMGTGAGVLSYRDKVYFTCIPDLFELQDTTGDGVADQKRSLHTGYGVRFAFRGHDLHGLIVGPDGRLYFSIGDRGYNISPDIKDPASGAVFRCNLDGSGLEVVCTGLRNPQELAFDQYGNLFTCDNNSDSGDKARWTELVPGGDSGWRMYYQYMKDRGPFNQEKIWHPWHEDSPAYIIPPVANFSDGPSGLEYYPGTGFGDQFKDKFFLCDFRGNASVSGIRSVRCEQNGAFWKLVDQEQPFWKMLMTDLDFGSDGKMYASDWITGWDGLNKGRIYSFEDPKHIDSELVKQVEQLLNGGIKALPSNELVELLGHVDQRVRQESQFELVARNGNELLNSVAANPSVNQLGRIHAIWGLEQLARKGNAQKKGLGELVSLLFKDTDAQVVIAATKLARYGSDDSEMLKPLLGHENLRVRYAGAMAMRHLASDRDLSAVVTMLEENADRDPLVRHAGIMVLKHVFQKHTAPQASNVVKLAGHKSPSVRIALAVALRKVYATPNFNDRFGHLGVISQTLSELLSDDSDSIVLEAARAIYDLPVDPAMPALAGLSNQLDRHATSDALMRRIIGANLRIGVQAGAKALAEIGSNVKVPKDRRVDAIQALADWSAPSPNDILLYDWRPLDPKRRNVQDARVALQDVFQVLVAAKGAVSNAAILGAGKLNIQGIGGSLQDVIWATEKSDSIRAAALTSFAQLSDISGEDRKQMIERLSKQFDQLPEQMAGEAINLIGSSRKKRALELIQMVLKDGSLVTQQSAIETLGKLKTPNANKFLASLVEKIQRDVNYVPTLRLDIVEAASKIADNDVLGQLKTYRNSLAESGEKSKRYADALVGGNSDAGAEVFYGKTEVSCVRCHRIDGTGGKVGPELSGIALKKDRQYLLEAIVDPNKVIAEGYTQVKVLTLDGDLFTGIVKQETDDLLVLLDSDGKEIDIAKDDIDDRRAGLSSMPDDMMKQLSPRELRDLVEFLSNRKTPPSGKTEHE